MSSFVAWLLQPVAHTIFNISPSLISTTRFLGPYVCCFDIVSFVIVLCDYCVWVLRPLNLAARLILREHYWKKTCLLQTYVLFINVMLGLCLLQIAANYCHVVVVRYLGPSIKWDWRWDSVAACPFHNAVCLLHMLVVQHEQHGAN